MNTQLPKKSSHLKNTLVGIIALSALTGGLLLLEDYRSNKEAMKFSEHLSRYTVPVKANNNALDGERNNAAFFKRTQDDSLLTTDISEQAAIAEQNLLSERENSMHSAVGLSTAELNSSKFSSSKLRSSKEAQIDNKGLKDLEKNKNDVTDVYFALSSSVIAPEYKLELVSVAEHIKSQVETKQWQIVGNTDKSGSATYNLKLAKERARKVANFLVNQGVAENQLTLITLGEYEAMQLANSTYNYGLRKVRVMEYKPETQELAITVQKRNEKIEQRRIALIERRKDEQKKQEQQRSLFAKQQEKAVSQKQQNTPINMYVNDPDTVQVNTDLLLDEINLGFDQQGNSDVNLNQSNLSQSKLNQTSSKMADETTVPESNEQLKSNNDELNSDKQVNNKKEGNEILLESAQVSSISNLSLLTSTSNYSL